MRGIVSRDSQRIGILRLVTCRCGHPRSCITSLLLCICSLNPWVLLSGVGAAAEYHLQLLGHQVMHSVARLNADLSFLALCHRRHMLLDCVCFTRLIRIRIIVCSVNFHLQLWYHFIHWVAAQAVRLSGIPKVARSRVTQCSKSCDLQPSPHCSVQYVGRRGFCPV